MRLTAVDRRAASRGEYLLRLNAEDPDRPSERRNAELHGVGDRMRVLHSDLFDALEPGERFDLIFWNSNYNAINPTELHHALFDRGFETIGGFSPRRRST